MHLVPNYSLDLHVTKTTKNNKQDNFSRHTEEPSLV